jgi:hypothetical protein
MNFSSLIHINYRDDFPTANILVSFNNPTQNFSECTFIIARQKKTNKCCKVYHSYLVVKAEEKMKSVASCETEIYMSYKNIIWNLRTVANHDVDNQLSNLLQSTSSIGMAIKKFTQTKVSIRLVLPGQSRFFI